MVFKNKEIAFDILGDDIIFPDEIAEKCGLFYKDASLKHLAKTIPSKETLQWCKENNYAVVAGPPESMGIIEMYSLNPDFFFGISNEGFRKNPFLKEDRVMTEWLMIYKEPVPNSTNARYWNEAIKLLLKEEQVPNAAKMTWFIMTFYEVRSIRLFERTYVRTSSVSSDNKRCIVGVNDEKGLDIDLCEDGDRRHYHIALAACRRLPEGK